ncbi:MAG: aminoacyltransferase, partial [Chloroflexota bacterium]|nr:aminoacyltransferase [Chloroflexota bacterium]
ERVLVDNETGTALAQILFRKRGPFTVAYMPRGPVVGANDALAADLLRGIDAVCTRHRAILLVIEPHKTFPPSWLNMDGAFAPGPASFQTSRTVKVELVDDATLLAQMRKDTRYNITYAQRKGVSIENVVANATNLDVFYRLLGETAERNGFGIHARAYYEDFLACFGEQAVLLFSHAQGVVTAGLIAARFGLEARSMYAGSAGAHRGRGDSALLRFVAMQWARELGCLRYDLGGIASASRTGRGGCGFRLVPRRRGYVQDRVWRTHRLLPPAR